MKSHFRKHGIDYALGTGLVVLIIGGYAYTHQPKQPLPSPYQGEPAVNISQPQVTPPVVQPNQPQNPMQARYTEQQLENGQAVCHVQNNGIANLPDPGCTPGDVNPQLTADVICAKGFTTKNYRDKTTSMKVKAESYVDYGIPHPQNNSGATQSYELDHLISLELGGADTMLNIWPEAASPKPGFREKDKVENYLHKQVCLGKMTLQEAQRGIATNWTQYMSQAGVK